MKSMSFFMVCTSTFLQIPVIINFFINIKALTCGLLGSLTIVVSVSSLLLVVNFLIVAFYTMKFLNIEIPNEQIPWSHNINSGFYFKFLLKVLLASVELYRI